MPALGRLPLSDTAFTSYCKCIARSGCRRRRIQSDESDFHGVLLLVSDDKIGVSLCDITVGMNAVIGILQALLQRERTGRGSVVKVSLFDSAADLMAVPYLQARYGGSEPEPEVRHQPR